MSPLSTLDLFVLSLEDDPVQSEQTHQALAPCGCQVVTVTTTEQALAAVAAYQFDLILVDVDRLHFDLREIGTTPAPLVALATEMASGAVAGFSHTLLKPVDPHAVSELLRNLETQQAAPSAPAGVLVEPSRVQAISLGDRSFENRLLTEFLESATQSLARIQSGIKTQEWDVVLSSAHSLKGLSFNLGAQALGQVCAHIESFARNPEPGSPSLVAWVQSGLSYLEQNRTFIHRQFV